MRVLFISSAEMPDYQCDMLLHGLRELLDADAVDSRRVGYMYSADIDSGRVVKADLYGKGFTMYGLLGNDDHVDRDDISAKIAARFFDLIVFGSVRRCRDHLDDVLLHYPPNQIAFVDGEDDQTIIAPLLGRGIYFKRELHEDNRFVRPIQFAIPLSKINRQLPAKRKAEAYIDPRDRTTYIYETEEAYVNDYAESYFGFTQRKAGWDCLRHYEIMANGCMPNFEAIEACPPLTMVFLPKLELLSARVLLAEEGPDYFLTPAGRDKWTPLMQRVSNVLHNHLTTVALARYVLDVARSPNADMPMISASEPVTNDTHRD